MQIDRANMLLRVGKYWGCNYPPISEPEMSAESLQTLTKQKSVVEMFLSGPGLANKFAMPFLVSP